MTKYTAITPFRVIVIDFGTNRKPISDFLNNTFSQRSIGQIIAIEAVLAETLNSPVQNLPSRNYRYRSVRTMRNEFRRVEPLSVADQCDGQTDGQNGL